MIPLWTFHLRMVRRTHQEPLLGCASPANNPDSSVLLFLLFESLVIQELSCVLSSGQEVSGTIRAPELRRNKVMFLALSTQTMGTF